MRDKQLDNYRGLIILYIVTIIHLMYWKGFGDNPIGKSLLLVEMPVIFFITGASYALSSKKGYVKYLINKFFRIGVPYIIFSIFAIAISYVYAILSQQEVIFKEMAFSWLNPFGYHLSDVIYLNWHIWFVPVYIIIAIVMPVLFKIYTNENIFVKTSPLIGIFLLIFCYDQTQLNWFKTEIFYCFFVYLGFIYKDIIMLDKKMKDYYKNAFICIGIVGIVFLIYLIRGEQYILDMQLNKFPPNFAFLLFSIIALCILNMFTSVFNKMVEIKGINKIIRIFSKSGYTIYLYQPIYYLLMDYLFNKLCIYVLLAQYKSILFLVSFIFIILVSIIVAKILGKIETIQYKR